MLKRPAFFLDIARCTGCKTCEIACKDKHDLPAGIRWRKVYECIGGGWQKHPDGTFSQDVRGYYISLSCNHCRRPECAFACPTGAMHQSEGGLVLVNRDECIGCGLCLEACPYDAPQMGPDDVAGKCDFCRDELAKGGTPACVAACPTRALNFGEYEELAARYGGLASLPPLPPAEATEPSLVLLKKRPGQGCSLANPEEVGKKTGPACPLR